MDLPPSELPPPDLVEIASRHGCSGLVPVGSGLEFAVFRATAADGSGVVLRTPVGGRFQGNANDPVVDTRALLRWENAVTKHVAGFGIPVATPRALVLGDRDVLISDYLPDDGTGAGQAGLGALLRRLHDIPPPTAAPPHPAKMSTVDFLVRRITQRWAGLRAIVPDLPAAPAVPALRATLAGARVTSLVHLDVRAANLRCVGGTVRGLLDWSNALISEPLLELARVAEFALLPANGIDFHRVLAAYGTPEPTGARYWLYRLDAALMLALVFTSEAPDPVAGARAVDRLVDVRARLLRHWDR
ncbi:phosphotransferase family protein [Actinokineospora bangkokensis]|uniref:Aminoglycoside phosphotransferase domain-containing protein n=1 Tax=Actinokineospora bangkokensis TaxID=1193682 RepID=A0A1Q9LMI8_9PSEU|nr:phosphotransferase [Actinokineospora bangkokensis]OLR93252.1 hypothetical protein BJP25_17355 [Actinokineospora bangkokensis]